MKKFLSNKGFTLVELLVVVAIIGVLTAIGFAVFTGLTGKGNDQRRQADLKAFGDAMEIKKADNSTYQSIVATDFAAGVFPREPTTRPEKYCYKDGTSVIANPSSTTGWTNQACATGWENVSGNAPTVAATATYFKFCTLNNAKDAFFCYGSTQ